MAVTVSHMDDMIGLFGDGDENSTASLETNISTMMTTSMMTSTTTTKAPETTTIACHPSMLPRCDPFMIAVEGIQWYGIKSFFFIGIPGNILIFIILLRLKPFNSSSIWLLCLAGSDLIHLIDRCVHDILILDTVLGVNGTLSDFTCRFFTIISRTMEYYSNWILIGLTVERFIAVWFPLQMNIWCTKTKAAIGSAVLFSVCLGGNMPLVETYRRHYYFAMCLVKGKYRKFWQNVYDEKIMIALFVTVPVLSILVLNSLIILGLRRSSRIQKQISEAQAKEKLKQQAQINRMLIAATVWFICTLTPFFVYNYYKASADWYDKKIVSPHVYRMRYGFARFLDVLRFSNVVANFFLYVVAARKFRHELIRLLTLNRFPRSTSTKTNTEKKG